MSHPAQLSNALSRVFAPPPTVSGWDTSPNHSTPPNPQPSCHSGEMVRASHSPPRAAMAPSSSHPCPAGWHGETGWPRPQAG